MDLQDPKVQRTLFATLVSVLMLYAFFGTSLMSITYGARSKEITNLEAEHERLTRELERARLTVGNMAKLEREFEYLHRQWTVAQTLLPDEDEISGLLRKVTAAGTQAGMEFVKFEPQPSLGRGFYQENPVSVEVEGGFHQVGTFLSSIANLGRILNVRNLRLEGVKPEDQAKPEVTHSLSANLEIVSYSLDRSVVGPPAPDMGSGGKTLAQSAPVGSRTTGHIRSKLNQASAAQNQKTQASLGGK